MVSLSKGSSFLKTGVTAASFKLPGNTPLIIVSLKSLYKTLAVASERVFLEEYFYVFFFFFI